MTELYEKSLSKLELGQVLTMLSQCAGSEGGKAACLALTPDSDLDTVRELLAEMHELYRRGYTPKVKPTKSCNACSLKELCLPKLMKSRAVSAYLRAAMEESP